VKRTINKNCELKCITLRNLAQTDDSNNKRQNHLMTKLITKIAISIKRLTK